MTQRDIARMVKQLRIALGLTQEQFAAKVVVTFIIVNHWENDRSTPSPLAMKRIEAILKKAKSLS